MKILSPVRLVGLLLTALCLGLYVLHPPFIQALSNYAYDGFIRNICVPQKSGRVAIVDIDNESLEKKGQWPWPRYRVAKLTEKLQESGAAVVVFDIIFLEPDRTSPEQIKKDMDEYFDLDVAIKGVPNEYMDFDAIFAKALSRGKTILGCYMTPVDDRPNEVDISSQPDYASPFTEHGPDGLDVRDFLLHSKAVNAPLTDLAAHSHTAYINAITESDNIVRFNPIVFACGKERLYPSLALEALRLYKNEPQSYIRYDEGGVSSIRVGDLIAPTDKAGRVVINFREAKKNFRTGTFSSFRSYPAVDVLNDKVAAKAFRDKIVFIGTSAAGLTDLKATPVASDFPGVEVHATIVDNILSGDSLRLSNFMPMVHILSILLVGIFLTIAISRSSSWLSFLIVATVIYVSIHASFLLFRMQNLVFVPVWLIISNIIIYPVLTMMKYWEEERQKKKVRSMFGTMVSEDVLHYLENNPGSFSLSGHKTEATIFFSDIAGFASISETLKPEQISDLLNRYLSPMTDAIMDRGGYVDKYVGDLIMAVWGVPFATNDHAIQACLAALEQQRLLKELRPHLRQVFGHSVFVRMGINTGSVTAGNMGSDKKFQFTVIGDVVNQASRFEPVNKDYHTDIIIGESTYEAAKEKIEARLLDKIIVQGITRPINIYELLSTKGELHDERESVRSLYETALRAHWEREWDAAEEALVKAAQIQPDDGPSFTLMERIRYYRKNPPDEAWLGEYVRSSKY